MFFNFFLKTLFKKNIKRNANKEEQKMTVVSGNSLEGSKDGLSFQFKDGRRFQNETGISYVLPNDFDGMSHQSTFT